MQPFVAILFFYNIPALVVKNVFRAGFQTASEQRPEPSRLSIAATVILETIFSTLVWLGLSYWWMKSMV